jgi:hypothetical protein
MRRATLFVSIVSTWLFRGHYVYPLAGRIQDGMASRLLIIEGIEMVHMIRKGQLDCPAGQAMSAADQF